MEEAYGPPPTLDAICSVHDGYFVQCDKIHCATAGQERQFYRACVCAGNDSRATFGYLVVIQIASAWGGRDRPQGVVLMNHDKIVAVQFPAYPITFHLFFDTMPAVDAFLGDCDFKVANSQHWIGGEASRAVQAHMNLETGEYRPCMLCVGTNEPRDVEIVRGGGLVPHLGDDTTCCVCLEPMRRSSRRSAARTCSTLLCGHTLHTECLPRGRYVWDYVKIGEVWARELKCPLCRFQMYWAETTTPDTSANQLQIDLDEYYSVFDPLPARPQHSARPQQQSPPQPQPPSPPESDSDSSSEDRRNDEVARRLIASLSASEEADLLISLAFLATFGYQFEV